MRSSKFVYWVIFFVVGNLLTNSCIPEREIRDSQALRRAEIKRLEAKEALSLAGREKEALLVEVDAQAKIVASQQHKIAKLERDLEEVSSIMEQTQPGQNHAQVWSEAADYFNDRQQGSQKLMQQNEELRRRMKILAAERQGNLAKIVALQSELQGWQNKVIDAKNLNERQLEEGAAVRKLEAALLEKQKKTVSLQEEQETLQASHVILQKKIASLEKKLEQTQSDATVSESGLRQQQVEAEAREKKAQQELAQLRKAMAGTEFQVKSLEQRVRQQLEEQSAEFAAATRSYETVILEIKGRLAEKEASMKNLAAVRQQLEQKLSAVLVENKNLLANHRASEQQAQEDKISTDHKIKAEESVGGSVSSNRMTISYVSSEKSDDSLVGSPAKKNNHHLRQLPDETSLDSLPVVARVESAVKRWGQAWSAQNVDEYLSFYSTNFEQSAVTGRAAWEKLRRSRLTEPKYIRISLADIRVNLVDSTTSRIDFVQSYESNSYHDQVSKIIEMRKEGGEWKIVREGVK